VVASADGQGAGAPPSAVPHIAAAMEVLRTVARQRRTVFIAAADLAHVGPAFGDPAPQTEADRARVREADCRLLDAIVCGDRDRFLEEVRSVGDANRICGLAPIYMTLWATGPTHGRWLAYDQCAADDENGSFVSIAGALMYERS
jgi:AmmeMemoRadiSam system protein B